MSASSRWGLRNRMKMKRRNRVETQSGNEERGRGRAGDKGTEGQGYFSPCLSVSHSPALPLSRSPALRPTHSRLCVSARLRLRAGAAASVKGAAEFEKGAHAHRLSILNCGMKEYFLGRLDGCLGQSMRQPAHRADVADAPVGAEDDGQHNRALDFVQAGLFGVFGFLTIEDCRFQSFGHFGYIAAGSRRGAAARAK